MNGSLMTLLSAPAIDPSTGRGPEWGKAAPVALLVVVLMGIALYLLIKSMNKHLRKVPADFSAPAIAAGAVAGDRPEPAAEPVHQSDLDREAPAPG